MDPDLDLCRQFLARHQPLGRVLICAVTGSHHYGFPSADSDLDIKGIHLAPTERFLGMSRPPDAHDRLTVFEGVECDLTTNEAGRALSLMMKGNGNMLERIFSPHRVFDAPGLLQPMRALAKASLSTACYNHYAGYFKGMCSEHMRSEPRAKSLLYTYRVALTGAHLLKTGEVVAHLPTLAPIYGFESVMELVDKKVRTAEAVPLTQAESVKHRSRWDELEGLLRIAADDSELPPGPTNGDQVEAFLVNLRKAEIHPSA